MFVSRYSVSPIPITNGKRFGESSAHVFLRKMQGTRIEKNKTQTTNLEKYTCIIHSFSSPSPEADQKQLRVSSQPTTYCNTF